MADKTYRTNRTYILFFGVFFIVYFLFSVSAPLAQAACVERCPSGQNVIGNCSLDPGCDPDIASCPQGVECAPSTTTQRRTQTQTTSTSRLLPINPLCFEEGECRAAPYKGIPQESVDCKNQKEKRWVDAGYIYQCYSKQATVDLQVSIGGYKVTGIGEYLRRLYIYLVSIAGITAGIMIVWAGVKWLTSAGIPDRITDAKKKIASAAMGLVLVLSSYVLLQTINPALVNLKMPPVTMVRQQMASLEVVPCNKHIKFPCGGFPGQEVQDESSWAGFASDTGLYNCSDSQYLQYGVCNAQSTSQCWGQYCAGGQEGCHSVLWDRIDTTAGQKFTEIINANLNSPGNLYYQKNIIGLGDKPKSPARACFNRTQCQRCENISIDDITTKEGMHALLQCASTACNCVVSVEGGRENLTDLTIAEGGFICVKRKAFGQQCENDTQCDQSAGLVCIPGLIEGIRAEFAEYIPLFTGELTRDPGESGYCGMPQSDWQVCHEDSDCASGICVQETLGQNEWRCTGMTQGSYCGVGRRCADGFDCIDTHGNNECYDGSPGSSCTEPGECDSLNCSVSFIDGAIGRVGECR